jgi:hypothetical protein
MAMRFGGKKYMLHYILKFSSNSKIKIGSPRFLRQPFNTFCCKISGFNIFLFKSKNVKLIKYFKYFTLFFRIFKFCPTNAFKKTHSIFPFHIALTISKLVGPKKSKICLLLPAHFVVSQVARFYPWRYQASC